MMRKLAFIGYGALAKQIINLVKPEKDDELIYFDDIAFNANIKNASKFSDYLEEGYKDFTFCVCLGYKHLELKQKIVNELLANNRKLLTFVHHTAHIDETAKIGEGVIIYPMCNVDQNVNIKIGTLLNNSVVVSHDSTVGECCFLAPGTVLSGEVTIGSKTFIGSGSLISNSIAVGENCKIGIGSVIIRNLKDNSRGLGNPFKNIKDLRLT